MNGTDIYHRAEAYYLSWQIDEIELTLRNTPHLYFWPPVIGSLYVAMVMLLPGYLVRNGYTKLAPKVSGLMQVWNLFLSVLSIGMFLGITFPLIDFYRSYGLWGIVCDGPRNFCQPGVFVWWLCIFSYSKIFEMVDTLLLILKNPARPVPFLHWYHHLSVFWFTWFASNWRLSAGMTFAAMNSLIHSFMYWYYFKAERGSPPSWAKLLTIGQITQMIIGLGINIAWAWGYLNNYNCGCDKQDVILVMGIVMYASYLFLFLKFFVERYILKRPVTARAKSAKAPAASTDKAAPKKAPSTPQGKKRKEE
eukprot:TRINITY_DN436_c0_g1_i1.p1 TRINITY_DN436_c0_g1~~TRINITY_DN436_c0_g1_i1.p1  ORF type:complete len:307 (+),score=41.54 TRINITY_DN436_c0_g1_i1:61-981(+)